jgi:transcriptional regulator of acetoin/glycerol metabolism
VRPAHLPPEIRGGRVAQPDASGAARPEADDAVERDRVLDALDRAGGNRTRAAGLLGISRATLYRRLERLGIRARS